MYGIWYFMEMQKLSEQDMYWNLNLIQKNVMALFQTYGSTVSRIQIHYKETVCFYLQVPRSSWYSFDQPCKDERLS